MRKHCTNSEPDKAYHTMLFVRSPLAHGRMKQSKSTMKLLLGERWDGLPAGKPVRPTEQEKVMPACRSSRRCAMVCARVRAAKDTQYDNLRPRRPSQT